MRYTITALDLHFLALELQGLSGAKVEKIYQPEKQDFLIVLHVPNKGKTILRINLPRYVFLTDFKGAVPDQPSHFCMMLRKYLSNARLRDVGQAGFERVLDILFETKDQSFRLIIELFSKGNIILASPDYVIKSPLFPKRWKDRTVRGNAPYEFPKQRYDLLAMGKDEFFKAIKQSDKESIVKTLALELSLGGRYAEELCLRAGIDKSKAELDEAELGRLWGSVEELLKSPLKPMIIYKDEEPFDITPVELELYKDHAKEGCSSFNAALESVLSAQLENEQKEAAEAESGKERRRLEAIVKQQEESIAKLERSSEENQRKGELIFESYMQVKEVLEELEKAKKKLSWKEIKARLKDHPVIKELHEKNNEVIVEL